MVTMIWNSKNIWKSTIALIITSLKILIIKSARSNSEKTEKPLKPFHSSQGKL